MPEENQQAVNRTETKIVVNDDAATDLITMEFERLFRSISFNSIQARSLGEILILKANLVEQREQLNWDAALAHFREIRRHYTELVGAPGVNTIPALELVFRPLMLRFYKGERSPELYRAMMSVE